MSGYKTAQTSAGAPTDPENSVRPPHARESGPTGNVDPQAAHLGVRKRLVREKGRRARAGRRGCPRGACEEDPRGGGTRRFDPEVEVEC